MVRVFFGVLLLLPGVSLLGQPLVRVQQHGKQGLLDTAGSWISFCDYPVFLPYSQGRALVSDGNLEGFLNRAGELAIPLQYEMAGVFAEGVAPAQLPGQAWGYIDTVGNWQIPPQFDGAEVFSQGLAAVSQADLWGFIDPSGEFRITPRYLLTLPFSNGLAAAQDTASGLWGYILPTGKWAVPPTYTFVLPHVRGWASVKQGSRWGVIGQSGTQVLPPIYHSIISSPTAGRIWAETDSGFVCYAPNGRPAFAGVFEDVGAFGEDWAPVKTALGSWEYLDAQGRSQLELPHNCSHAEPFSEGMAQVICQGKVGYINRSGTQVIAAVYDGGTAFALGRAGVRKGERWALINARGELLTSYLFEEAPQIDVAQQK